MALDEEVEAAICEISQILRGRGSAVQGVILADLLAMWLAGHVGPDAETARKELLERHLEAVQKLVPINEKIILKNLKRDS